MSDLDNWIMEIRGGILFLSNLIYTQEKSCQNAVLLIVKSGRIKVVSVTEEKVKSTYVYKY
jgi:hypothetical protein